MPKTIYKLKPPTDKTKQRLKEVQFYLFLSSFFYKYNHNNRYIMALVETLAELFDCKPTVISILLDHFKSPVYKPNKEEIAVAGLHLKIPKRQLAKISGMASETYYTHLTNYIASGEPELEPRISETYTEELEKFLDHAVVMFRDVSHSLRGFEIYKC
jgi:hypothetical protein